MIADPSVTRHDARHALLGFAPQWLAVAVLALLDVPLSLAAGLHFHVGTHDGYFLALPMLAAAIALRRFAWPRGADVLEFLALVLIASTAMAVLTYVALARSGTLVDTQLLAMDRAIGFNWQAWHSFVMSRPLLSQIFRQLYFSAGYQALYLIILLGLMRDTAQMHRVFWLLFIGTMLTALGCWLVPALGPFKVFHELQYAGFLPVMEHLRSGRDLDFPLGQLQGVVSFPSFHTTLALGLIYAFRRTGVIGKLVMAANITMLAAIPVFGGHYLMDMFAGAAVLLASLAILKIAPALRTPLAPALLRPAAST